MVYAFRKQSPAPNVSGRAARTIPLLLLCVLMLSLGACAGSQTAAQDDTESDNQLSRSEQPPELIGGMRALYSELEYPQMARQHGREGRAVVQFVVSPEGKAVEVRILDSSGTYALDHEAQRAIRRMDWRPGMKDGEPVRVQMSLPVTFGLNR